ncbi:MULTISPECIES: helix-turn-helix domain-containing protein [Listeria]|uniref:helix-turn-helix domain-containing protein n=1 Tax=Listeria TaxID=1637 RepID=UPI001FC9B6ED|nr:MULTISPECIES: helix-turn-helix domain-containing protein [Listeria]
MKKLLHYEIICEATLGDALAIQKVLHRYMPYINTLATRNVVDEYGNSFFQIDEEIRKRLENKLTETILLFEV